MSGGDPEPAMSAAPDPIRDRPTAGARFVRRVERLLGHLLVLLMAVMVLDVSWQVVSRYLLRSPSSFTEELAGFLLIWIGLLGSAYALRTRAHLGIDLLVQGLPGAARRWAIGLSHTVVLLFALTVMVGGGLRLVQLAFQLQQISAATGIRMGYVYLVVPLSGLLIAIFSIASISDVFAGSGGDVDGKASAPGMAVGPESGGASDAVGGEV